MLIILKKKALNGLKCNFYSIKSYFSTRVLNKESQPSVVFFGSDQFSLKILVGLSKLIGQSRISKLSVVTSLSKSNPIYSNSSSNKTNKIVDYCEANNIAIHMWPQLKNSKNYLRELNSFDIGIVASFGHLIPGDLIEIVP
jgi:methionyl-tRNA formyltransferase